MRKFLLSIGVVVLAFSSAQSQEINYGVKAGVNFANMAFKGATDLPDTDSRTSFHVGGFVEIPISERFSVQPELLYSSLGSKTSESIMGFSYETTAKLEYLSLPVMAKYYVINNLALELGPQFSMLVTAKEDRKISRLGESESYTEDLKKFMDKLDIGLGVGASYKLDLGVFFSARYVMGIANIFKDDQDEFDVDYDFNGKIKVKNNVFQLSAGYSF